MGGLRCGITVCLPLLKADLEIEIVVTWNSPGALVHASEELKRDPVLQALALPPDVQNKSHTTVVLQDPKNQSAESDDNDDASLEPSGSSSSSRSSFLFQHSNGRVLAAPHSVVDGLSRLLCKAFAPAALQASKCKGYIG